MHLSATPLRESLRTRGDTIRDTTRCAACAAVCGYFYWSAAHVVAAPIHTSPDESRPHSTWEIRSGGEFGDGQFVCGSAKPTAPCRLTASTPERPTLVTLHLYLHPTALQTNYVGAWRAPFLRG